MNLRINRAIKAPKVRLIDKDGNQLGIVSYRDALQMAMDNELDLVEIAPNAAPPVCKVMNYGKYRYAQAKKEKESKKVQHQIKVKEVKLKPNTDENDFNIKARNACKFLEQGCKVKISLMFRGREITHSEIGLKMVQRMCDELSPYGDPEAPPKRIGRGINVVVAPSLKKKKD